MLNLLLNWLPTLATVFLTICYIPQIIQTFKTKDVSGLNVKFWIFLNIALSLLFANATVVFIQFHTWGYMLTEFLNEGLALVMLIMVIKYRKK